MYAMGNAIQSEVQLLMAVAILMEIQKRKEKDVSKYQTDRNVNSKTMIEKYIDEHAIYYCCANDDCLPRENQELKLRKT
eukprot:Awhi_evm1s5549